MQLNLEIVRRADVISRLYPRLTYRPSRKQRKLLLYRRLPLVSRPDRRPGIFYLYFYWYCIADIDGEKFAREKSNSPSMKITPPVRFPATVITTPAETAKFCWLPGCPTVRRRWKTATIIITITTISRRRSTIILLSLVLVRLLRRRPSRIDYSIRETIWNFNINLARAFLATFI